jgi:flagellar biosynthesis/type III secretory pathway protein FliH
MGVLTDAREQHRYQTCRDEGCQRYACRVYREGCADGYRRGYDLGHAKGHAEGYSAGHADGYAAGAASCGDG